MQDAPGDALGNTRGSAGRARAIQQRPEAQGERMRGGRHCERHRRAGGPSAARRSGCPDDRRRPMRSRSASILRWQAATASASRRSSICCSVSSRASSCSSWRLVTSGSSSDILRITPRVQGGPLTSNAAHLAPASRPVKVVRFPGRYSNSMPADARGQKYGQRPIAARVTSDTDVADLDRARPWAVDGRERGRIRLNADPATPRPRSCEPDTAGASRTPRQSRVTRIAHVSAHTTVRCAY